MRQVDNLADPWSKISTTHYNPKTEDIFVLTYFGNLVFYNRNNIDSDPVTLGRDMNHLSMGGITPDGRVFVIICRDGTARVWAKGESGNWSSQVLDPTIVLADLESSDDDSPNLIRKIACRQDGKEVVTGSNIGTLVVWNKNEEAGEWVGTVLDDRKLPTCNDITSIKYSPNGKEFVSTYMGSSTLIWTKSCEESNWRSIEISRGKRLQKSIIAYHPTGSELLIAESGYVQINGDSSGDVSIWGR